MTISPTSRRPMTAEELMLLRDVAGRHELVRGQLVVGPLHGALHGAVVASVGAHLHRYVTARGLGNVLGPIGYVLTRDPDTVRAPDVSYLSAARTPPAELADGYVEGAPDLAVEVLSPTDTLYEVEDKIAQFLAAGTRLAWVINPRRRTVAVHAPGAPVHVLGEDDTADGADVVPGFRCAVREFMG